MCPANSKLGGGFTDAAAKGMTRIKPRQLQQMRDQKDMDGGECIGSRENGDTITYKSMSDAHGELIHQPNAMGKGQHSPR